jgi:hypothetical protein
MSCSLPYQDPLITPDKILVGYGGQSYVDQGYFYCPYVPILRTPTVLDPNTAIPSRGILTRYGKKALTQGASMYGKITISNGVITESAEKPKKLPRFRTINDPWEVTKQD